MSEQENVVAEDDAKMTIWEHLGELRLRLVRAALGLLVGTVACWVYREQILSLLRRPYVKAWHIRGLPGEPLLQLLGPSDVFRGYMQISLLGGVVVSIPIVFYQLWAFISPGLYSKEKRYIYPFVVFSSLLFCSGVAFAYFVAFPFTFDYFFSLLSPGLTQVNTLEYYLDFTTTMLLGFGAVFELPLFITFLSLAGIVSPKQLVRFWRWAVLGSIVVGAVVTPGPEITSQILVAGALVGLYTVSILFAYIVHKKPKDAAIVSE
jgi:sec-independent protein translocase protein TatC